MAKSKAEKQAEALERKRNHYVSHHLPNFINRSPIGAHWTGDLDDMLTFVQDVANLRRYAEEASMTLTGSRTAWESNSQWSVKQLFNDLVFAGTIHQFCYDCNETRNKAQLPRVPVDPIDVWGLTFQRVMVLVEHPKVKELLNAL
jgi:hypothetical protein